MSPLELSICLHYHSSCEDMPWCVEMGDPAPIRNSIMLGLCASGLLSTVPLPDREPGRKYWPTKKLHAFVAMLEDTPLPVEKWLDPRTEQPINGIR